MSKKSCVSQSESGCMQDPELQQQLDERLWSFDDTSFIPHGIDQIDARICISAQLPEQSDWIVFNFNDQALEQFEKFSHIIEIIENNESAKQQGREKNLNNIDVLGLKLEPSSFK